MKMTIVLTFNNINNNDNDNNNIRLLMLKGGKAGPRLWRAILHTHGLNYKNNNCFDNINNNDKNNNHNNFVKEKEGGAMTECTRVAQQKTTIKHMKCVTLY